MRHQEIFRPVLEGSARSLCGQFRASVRRFSSILSLLALASASSFAHADSQVRAVRLSNVVGSVQVLNGTETQFSQAYANMPLMQGSTLKTGEDGRTEIQFEDGSVARLTPNSSATLGVLTRDDAGNTNTELDLLTGLSYITMSGTANQRFVVHFGNNEVISPAPVKFRVNLDANPAELAVLDGSAHLTGGTAYSLDLKMNETVSFDANDPSRYFLAEGIAPDSWDQWNADRDQALGQMAAQETREARSNGNPAWGDLDYYGNWYTSPDGSSFWTPSGVGAGWDPYGSGYWGYYGAGGYSWISGYPWGWLPYHCGAWNYYNSFGWGWAPGPGGCGTLWYPYATVVVAPPGYRPCHPPAIGHLPVHGPVNLPRAGVPTLIRVDRGPAATDIAAHPVSAPKTVAINGGTARLIPKTSAPGISFVSRPTGGNVGLGRSGSESVNSPQLGSVPVYRPAAPTTIGSRQGYAPPSYSPHSSMSNGGMMSSSGHMSAPSASSASVGHAGGGGGGMPAPSGGGGGGGHVK
jgi:ferric-dicitrate binding protein FerR (iron transport regulator)